MCRNRILIWTLAALLLLLNVSGAYADHQWGDYHWEKNGTPVLTLNIGNNHTGDWPNLLSYVGSNWNAYGGSYLDFNVVAGGTGDIESYNANYGDTGWLGLASIWVTRGKNKHITRGESKVNEYYITLPGYDGFNEEVEFKHVLCQEIGHTFGLDHNREGSTGGTPDNTCMNDQTRPLGYPDPNSHDTELLNIMYAEDHADGGGGGGSQKCHPVFGCPQGLVHAFWAEHYEDDHEMYEASDAVVDVTVLASSFSHMAGPDNSAVPITRVVLKIEETFKGKTSRVISLQQTRGLGLEIEDDPGYVEGDSYTLFLRQIGKNNYRVVNPNGRIKN
ncbi:MAG: hypothetical protein OEZ51_02125 [Nitrospinota bacterium]|nr:hypothetical protein [Nitrospinota bacterium]